jgi:hypothetical protein
VITGGRACAAGSVNPRNTCNAGHNTMLPWDVREVYLIMSNIVCYAGKGISLIEFVMVVQCTQPIL